MDDNITPYLKGYILDLIQLIFLVFLSICIINYTSFTMNQTYFLILLVLFFISKKNHIWFVFILLVLTRIGGFFDVEMGDSKSLAYYRVAPGVVFHFFELFFFAALLKAIIKGEKKILIFRKPIKYIIYLIVIIALLSLGIGITIDDIIYHTRLLLVYTGLISIPYLLLKKEDYIKLVYLIFPFIFIILSDQLFYLFTKQSLGSFFSISSVANIEVKDIDELLAPGRFELRAANVSVPVIIISFFFSQFFILQQKSTKYKSFLYFVLFASLIVVLLSATRYLMGIIFFSFIISVLFILKVKRQIILYSFSGILLFVMLYFVHPRFKLAIDQDFERFMTVKELSEEGITDETVNGRVTRVKNVLAGFKKSPVLGMGFSSDYFKYFDFHAGNFNMLLQVGIVGFLFFVYFWFYIFYVINNTRKKLSKINNYRNAFSILFLFVVSTMIAHFTTKQMFGISIDKELIFLWVIFLVSVDFFIKDALEQEDKIQREYIIK